MEDLVVDQLQEIIQSDDAKQGDVPFTEFTQEQVVGELDKLHLEQPDDLQTALKDAWELFLARESQSIEEWIQFGLDRSSFTVRIGMEREEITRLFASLFLPVVYNMQIEEQ